MRVLITGANSLLGKALWQMVPASVQLILTDLPERPIPDAGSAREALDVTAPASVRKLVTWLKPHVIIHLAALSDVDYCQQHPERAERVNVAGTHTVMEEARKIGATLVFASSNGVFNGRHAPYGERARPQPLNVYGRSKAKAEEMMRSDKTAIVVRLMTMYGWPPPGSRDNPVTWALTKLKKGKSLTMVTDHFVNPLYAPSAADAIWKLIEKNARGTFHIAGKTRLNRFSFTREIARVFGYDPVLVKPVSSAFFPSLTSRPRDTTLNTAKLEHSIDWKPLTAAQGLRQMFQARPTSSGR